MTQDYFKSLEHPYWGASFPILNRSLEKHCADYGQLEVYRIFVPQRPHFLITNDWPKSSEAVSPIAIEDSKGNGYIYYQLFKRLQINSASFQVVGQLPFKPMDSPRWIRAEEYDFTIRELVFEKWSMSRDKDDVVKNPKYKAKTKEDTMSEAVPTETTPEVEKTPETAAAPAVAKAVTPAANKKAKPAGKTTAAKVGDRARYTPEEDNLIFEMMEAKKPLPEIKTALMEKLKIDRSIPSLTYRVYRVLAKTPRNKISYAAAADKKVVKEAAPQK